MTEAGAGSSPRMRGTPDVRLGFLRECGIIPAYAGNTCSWLSSSAHWRDHPRVCGEHSWPRPLSLACAGSSPRMRGTPIVFRIRSARVGIIPAYAGNTPVVSLRMISSEDHPRVCGEHYCELKCSFSSVWIIPAYAGNTKIVQFVVIPCEDHPRVCGEHGRSTKSLEIK